MVIEYSTEYGLCIYKWCSMQAHGATRLPHGVLAPRCDLQPNLALSDDQNPALFVRYSKVPVKTMALVVGGNQVTWFLKTLILLYNEWGSQVTLGLKEWIVQHSDMLRLI